MRGISRLNRSQTVASRTGGSKRSRRRSATVRQSRSNGGLHLSAHGVNTVDAGGFIVAMAEQPLGHARCEAAEIGPASLVNKR